MRAYLTAHDEFVAWIDGLQETPSIAEVDRRQMILALSLCCRPWDVPDALDVRRGRPGCLRQPPIARKYSAIEQHRPWL
jgi:hypothetical protein